MIVFNLTCEIGHRFEGWFRSSDAYVAQRAQAQVRCPVCESAEIHKLLTAPRLNLSAHAKASKAADADEASAAKLAAAAISDTLKKPENRGSTAYDPTPAAAAMAANTVTESTPTARPTRPQGEWDGTPAQQALIENAVRALRRRILDNTENVGQKFAQVARAIHKGDEEERGIRGTVTPKEAEALADEGIATTAVPAGFFEEEKLH